MLDEEARQRVELAVPVRDRAFEPPPREGPERRTRVLSVRRQVKDIVAGPPQQEVEPGSFWACTLRPERFVQGDQGPNRHQGVERKIQLARRLLEVLQGLEELFLRHRIPVVPQ